MPETFQNLYHRREVGPGAAKPCFICHKPTSIVLITVCNKDFFYVCAGHLLDRGFAIPEGTAGVDISKEAEKNREAAEKKRKQELNEEIERVKEEYEEQLKRRRAKGKEKNNKNQEKEDDEDKSKDEKERDDKIKKRAEQRDGDSKTISDSANPDNGPRAFNLHKSIYQMRTNRVRQVQIAKRDRETLQKTGGFPSVPTSNPQTQMR